MFTVKHYEPSINSPDTWSNPFHVGEQRGQVFHTVSHHPSYNGAKGEAKRLNAAPTAANAVKGDIVLNLTTYRIGKVTGTSQFGRILVDGQPQERWNNIVYSTQD